MAKKISGAEYPLCKIFTSDFEFTLPRPSYTAATLKALREQYSEHEFVLIIGEDNWDIFDKWKDYEEILRLHEIYIYPRKQTAALKDRYVEGPTLSERPVSPERPPFGLKEIRGVRYLREAPLFDISSTEIRNNCK